VHGTQAKIAALFEKAEKNAPSIICFDEFDSFVPSRSSMAAEHRPEEINEFLSQLNNCSKRGIFVIGTTNRIDMIDPAVLRRGRMDLKVEIPAPDAQTREAIFRIHLKGRPVSDDIDYAELAAMTDNYASADIAFIVNEAAMMAALADSLIERQHLVNSIKANPSSLGSSKSERPRIGFR
jgi:transitional endoplasmic reticulum ATPase